VPLDFQPRISVLLPVHAPRRAWIAEAVASVQSQTYKSWELCICDDASNDSELAQFLSEQARSDPRIRFVSSAEPLGIAGALNRARSLATGEYLTFLDHDDILTPDALYSVAEALRGRHEFLYSDEDYVDEGGISLWPHFKPDWSPELLSNCMYIGHLVVVSRERFDAVGGFRSLYDGAQDYDLALRLAEQCQAVHIPRVLYHWRQHARSIARSTASKPFAHEAGKRALEDAVRRRGWTAEVCEDTIPNQYVLRRWPAAGRRVSIVTPTPALGARSLTGYSPVEWIVAADRNRGASEATGAVVVFLDTGLAPLDAQWLSFLTGQLERAEVGVVGGCLVDSEGRLEHGGFVVGPGGRILAPGRSERPSQIWKWVQFTREVSAVSVGCFGVRREVFFELGGFDSQFPNLQGVDFCLRAQEAGRQVILEKNTALQCSDSVLEIDVASPDECGRFREKWQGRVAEDPFFSRNLELTGNPPTRIEFR
jgi:GT2 family glycosyltransferase